MTSCSDNLKPVTTTSLAISFSSPNLATNTSFSSSSESEYHDNATGGAKSVITIQNLLDDVGSIDENNDDGDESLNLAGENDVEYAELTQRMIFPATSATQKNQQPTAHSHQLLENATSEESSDLMLMNLFEATSHRSESSSSSTSSSTAQRPTQISSSSVLDNVNETAFHHHHGAKSNINNTNNISSISDGLASSLPHELSHHSTSVLSTSPVWKTQVS